MPLSHGKSQKAFVKNIKTEMHHGKPQKQALAIAYAIKRKAQHKAMGGKIEESIHEETLPHHEDVMRYGEPHLERVKMAKGGHVDPYHHSLKDPKFHNEEMANLDLHHEGTEEKHNAAALHEDEKKINQHLAHGGKVHGSHMAYGGKSHHSGMAHGGRVHHEVHMASGGHAHSHHSDHHAGDIVGRILHKHKYSRGGVVANEGDALASHQAKNKVREYDDLVADDHLESTQHDYGDHLGDAREDHDRADIVSKIMHSLKKKDRMPRAV